MIPIFMKPKRFVASLFNTKIRGDNVPNLTSFSRSSRAFLSSARGLGDLVGPRSDNWWTGLSPVNCPGFTAENKTLHSLPLLNLHSKVATRESLQNYFDNTWTLTEMLFAGLQSEDAFYTPPFHDLRHPLIFYYGHPAVLYVNKLRVAGVLKNPINEYFESLFETGVDEMSWDDLSKNRMKWPSVAEVHAYRQEVYNAITKVIQRLSDSEVQSINQSSPLWSLVLGFEHERIHLETSSFLMNEYRNLKYLRNPEHFPAYHSSMDKNVDSTVREPMVGRDYPRNDFIDVATTDVHLGKPRDFPTFGWDNEYGSRVYKVPSFRATRFKISNGEFLDFVKENGYARRELWSEDGWKWRSYRNVKWPTFWERNGPQGLHHYDLRLIYDMVAMNWKVPVSCNMHEATAFANWKSMKDGKTYRIMSELEHRAIRDTVTLNPLGYQNDPILTLAPGGLKDGESRPNTSLSCGSQSPVDALKPNSKGFYDVQGNAWEWCIDWFCALPGFEIHPYYEDFSTPCFDGLHNVIAAGSFISTGDLSSQFARYHFRPHFNQHASFRLVETGSKELATSDTDAPGPFVGNYPFRRSQASLDRGKAVSLANKNNEDVSRNFGYNVAGLNFFGLTPFTTSVTSFIRKSMINLNVDLKKSKLLEIGCGMGAVGFDLSKDCHSYLGIDPETPHIEIANKLLKGETYEFRLNTEGAVYRKFYASSGATDIDNVEFRNATPMCLPADLNPHDIVIINDCIDKLTSPGSLLGRLANARGICKKGGVVILFSNFQWSEDATPKSLWLGGYYDMSKNFAVSSVEALREYLKDDFNFISSDQIPCAWHESTYKMQNRVMTAVVLMRK
jgi:5-histidylcysteine sulfoxide synthase